MGKNNMWYEKSEFKRDGHQKAMLRKTPCERASERVSVDKQSALKEPQHGKFFSSAALQNKVCFLWKLSIKSTIRNKILICCCCSGCQH